MANESTYSRGEWKYVQTPEKEREEFLIYTGIVKGDDMAHEGVGYVDSEANAQRIVTAVNLLTEIEKLFSPNELTPLETYNKIALLLKNSTK